MPGNLIDNKWFVLGANLPWLDDQYDHDFGRNQVLAWLNQDDEHVYYNPSYASPTHRANVRSYLQNMSNMGVHVVRVFIFERFEGLEFDNQGYVTGIDSELTNNFSHMCDIAAQYNLKFYFCLMDTWGLVANYYNTHQKEIFVRTMNGLITTQSKTESFIERALIRFISNEKIKDRIFAIDILNEPEGLERNKIFQDYAIDTKITWEQLMVFVKRCAISLKKKKLRVSCGFQLEQSLIKEASNLKGYLDFYDFHKYDDNGKLPNCSILRLEKPCIIGECGQEKKVWDEKLQRAAIRSFLDAALHKGYGGCLVWKYGFKGFEESKKHMHHYHSLINSDGSFRSACNEIKEFDHNYRTYTYA